MSDPFDFLPESWSDFERELWHPFENYGFDDPKAQALFDAGYFSPGEWDSDQISAIREELGRHMMDEYGIDFDDMFDWDAWRADYE